MTTMLDPREYHVIVGASARATDPTILDLIQRDMEAATDEMRRIIAVEMFRTMPYQPPMFQAFYAKPSKWAHWFNPVKWYLVTLWMALRGVSLREDTDDDE